MVCETGELHVHHAAVAQHHDERSSTAAGCCPRGWSRIGPSPPGAHSPGSKCSVKNAGALLGAHPSHVLAHDAHAALVAVLAQPLEDLLGAVRVLLQPPADGGLVPVQLAGPGRELARAERRFIEPEAHGARVHGQLAGDLRPPSAPRCGEGGGCAGRCRSRSRVGPGLAQQLRETARSAVRADRVARRRRRVQRQHLVQRRLVGEEIGLD